MPLFYLPQPTALPSYSNLGQLPINCPKNKLRGRRAFLEQEKSKHQCVRRVAGVEPVKKAKFALRKSKKLQQSYAGSPPLLGMGLSSPHICPKAPSHHGLAAPAPSSPLLRLGQGEAGCGHKLRMANMQVPELSASLSLHVLCIMLFNKNHGTQTPRAHKTQGSPGAMKAAHEWLCCSQPL